MNLQFFEANPEPFSKKTYQDFEKDLLDPPKPPRGQELEHRGMRDGSLNSQVRVFWSVIKQIKPGDKILCGPLLRVEIETNSLSWLHALKRKIAGTSRHTTYQNLRDVSCLTVHLADPGAIELMVKAVNGIRNLANTYSEDSFTNLQFQCLADEIEALSTSKPPL